MTNLKIEIEKSWGVLKDNSLFMIVIITLLFFVGQVGKLNIIVYNSFISLVLKVVLMVVTIVMVIFLQLIVVSIVIKHNKDESISMKDIINNVCHEYKEIFLIIGLELLFLLIGTFIIPIGGMLIIAVSFIFVWPIFIAEEKRNIEVILESVKLLFSNFKDILKYLIIYAGIILIVSIIIVAEGLDMTIAEKVIIIIVKYFERFTTIFFTILATNLYLQYRKKNDKQSDFI